MNVIKKLIFTLGIILLFTNTLLGTEALAYYENDITPPWGRVYVEKSAKVDGTTYVGETPVSVKIYAKDDMSQDDEIKYYISTTPISNTTKLNTWYNYEEGKTHEITLNDDGTGKVYTIFKDRNGNTSLTYEANINTSQKIIFDKNGGQGDIQGVEKERIYGMPYIIPIQMPFKNGHTFLGWSTDKEATVGSYMQGDAIPADASLGTEESITLYAIYGNNLDTFPDLVDVVEIGDYVNYPVFYDNVINFVDSTRIYSECLVNLNGWRVLSKNEVTGEIKLVSAGIPLSLYKNNTEATCSSIISEMASTSTFLNIGFSASQADGKFIRNGFAIYDSLIEAFTNKYTKINSGIPEVRSIMKEDADSIYQYFGETTNVIGNGVAVNDLKYKELLAIPAITDGNYGHYWLANGAQDNSRLWLLFGSPIDGEAGRVGVGHYRENGVRPVVTLKPNIKSVGRDINGAWDIEMKKELEVPIAIIKEYTGTEQLLEFENLDTSLVNITGTTSATEPGAYTVTISIKEPGAYTWADGTIEPIKLNWKIVSTMVDIENATYYGATPSNIVTTDTSIDFNIVGINPIAEKLSIPIINLEIGKTYTLNFTESSIGAYYTDNLDVRVYGCRVSNSIDNNTTVDLIDAVWAQDSTGTNRNGSITFTAIASTMYWNWCFGILHDGATSSISIKNISIDLVETTPRIDFSNYTIHGVNAQVSNLLDTSLSVKFVGISGIYEKVNIPIVNLEVGKTYTLNFTESSSGTFLAPNTTNHYGCKVSNAKETGTSAKMNNLVWTYDASGSNRTGSITFIATASTMYWNWDFSRCSDGGTTIVTLANLSLLSSN